MTLYVHRLYLSRTTYMTLRYITLRNYTTLHSIALHYIVHTHMHLLWKCKIFCHLFLVIGSCKKVRPRLQKEPSIVDPCGMIETNRINMKQSTVYSEDCKGSGSGLERSHEPYNTLWSHNPAGQTSWSCFLINFCSRVNAKTGEIST